MGLLDPPALTPKAATALAVASNPSNVATRVPAGRFGTFDNTTAKTFQATFELVDAYDAVRIIFGSNSTAKSPVVSLAAVTAPAAASDVNNSAGSWVPVTLQNQTGFAVPGAPNGGSQVAVTVSDWIALPSVARSDGGAYPLLTVRAFMASNSTLPMLGDGTDSFTNWASKSNGRKFWWRNQNGDQITTPSGFTSTTNVSQCPILGVQYLCRGQVMTVGAVGDSITEGRGTYIGEGFVLPALEQLNAAGGPVKYEYACFGWSGQDPNGYTRRALNLLESELKPDIIVIPSGSPNPVSDGALTDAAVSAIRSQKARMLAAARDTSTIPIVWTWLPTNTSVRNYGSSDAKRVAYNAEVLGSAGRNLLVVDAATALSGSTSSGQVQLNGTMTGDQIHPNDTGNAAITALIKPALIAAAQRFKSGSRRYSTPVGEPVFLVQDTAAKISCAGTWIFNAGGVAVWTLPPLDPGSARQDSQAITVKAGEYSAGVLVNRSGSDAIDWGGVTTSQVVLKTGQSVTFVPGGGNGRWQTLGAETALFQAAASSAATTLPLDSSASLWTFTGSSSATWTLPVNRQSGMVCDVFNIGTAALTVQRASTDQIVSGNTLATSVVVQPGTGRRFTFSGTYWLTNTPANHVGMCLPLVGVMGTAAVSAFSGANRGAFVRIDRGGPVAKVRFEVGTASGNVSVAAYRNSGTGTAAVPTGAPLSTSGAVTCPASGIAEVSLGSTVYLNDGDWLFLSCDNATATFRQWAQSTQGLFSASGLYARQDTAHPAPTVGTLAALSAVPVLVGTT